MISLEVTDLDRILKPTEMLPPTLLLTKTWEGPDP